MTIDSAGHHDSDGAASASAYTRSPMETGILGSRRQVQLEAVGVEARMAIDAASQRLRELSDDVREAYGEAVSEESANSAGDLQPDSLRLAPTRAMLGRLELAGEQLDRLSQSVASASQAPEAELSDPATAVSSVLEAREEERSRLAAELHDGPAQALANLIFQTEILGHALRANPRVVDTELSTLRQGLERELDKLRAYINELRPPLMEPEALDEALRDSATELSGRTGMPVEARLEAPADVLTEPQRSVVLRVAQEALRNVGKHAGARRAWVSTDYSPGTHQWILEVGDDGRGFDSVGMATQTNRRHFGLRFMRERAELVGAKLSIDARPAAGTVVRLSINTGGQRS
jgi:two-component system, NarL family, sensor histidine kinase DegS